MDIFDYKKFIFNGIIILSFTVIVLIRLLRNNWNGVFVEVLDILKILKFK